MRHYRSAGWAVLIIYQQPNCCQVFASIMAKENLKEDNEEALQMKSPGSHHLCSRAGQQWDNDFPPTSGCSRVPAHRCPLSLRAQVVILQTCSWPALRQDGRRQSQEKAWLSIPHAVGSLPVTRSKVDESVLRQ